MQKANVLDKFECLIPSFVEDRDLKEIIRIFYVWIGRIGTHTKVRNLKHLHQKSDSDMKYVKISL